MCVRKQDLIIEEYENTGLKRKLTKLDIQVSIWVQAMCRR